MSAVTDQDVAEDRDGDQQQPCGARDAVPVGSLRVACAFNTSFIPTTTSAATSLGFAEAECLNENCFTNLLEARTPIERWRHYNEESLHSPPP